MFNRATNAEREPSQGNSLEIGEKDVGQAPLVKTRSRSSQSAIRLHFLGQTIRTTAVLALATAVAFVFDLSGMGEANLVMVYLFSVALIASWLGTKPAIGASILAVVLFDVFFTKPFHRITVEDAKYLVTFAVMLIVGLLISSLTDRLRRQTETSRKNEKRTEALYRLSRTLTSLSGVDRIRQYVEQTVSQVFDCHTIVFLPNEHGQILPVFDHLPSFAAGSAEISAAQWVYDHGQPSGHGTDMPPDGRTLYLPLTTSERRVGVLAVQPQTTESLRSLDARQLLATYATQIAFAIERDQLAEQSHQARLEIESEKLRNALLSSVSHDLRTPLAAIAGASSSMLHSPNGLPPDVHRELASTIFEESYRLTRLVENILHMTRLTSGAVKVNKEWHPVDDVVGSALHRMSGRLGNRPVVTEIADELPMGNFDSVLMEQVLINLLDNAIRYSPPESSIEIRAHSDCDNIIIEVADCGKGIQPQDTHAIFQQFYRHSQSTRDGGTGLGLAICKAIIDAHGGRISVSNRPQGGAVFCIQLPFDGNPPAIPKECDVQSELS